MVHFWWRFECVNPTPIWPSSTPLYQPIQKYLHKHAPISFKNRDKISALFQMTMFGHLMNRKIFFKQKQTILGLLYVTKFIMWSLHFCGWINNDAFPSFHVMSFSLFKKKKNEWTKYVHNISIRLGLNGTFTFYWVNFTSIHTHFKDKCYRNSVWECVHAWLDSFVEDKRLHRWASNI